MRATGGWTTAVRKNTPPAGRWNEAQ